jgi:hypothetical protein
MRNIIIIVLFVGAGFFLYKHPNIWRMPDESLAAPTPAPMESGGGPVARPVFSGDPGGSYALKETYRTAPDGPVSTRVVVVNGRYWRIENRLNGNPAQKIGVIVNNGVEKFSNLDAAYLSSVKDPRPELDALVVGALQLREEFAAYPPGAQVQYDGVSCWKTTADYLGLPVQSWINTETGFPVCIESSQNARYIEAHFTPIPIDFKKPETVDFFDPGHTDPIFANYLP